MTIGFLRCPDCSSAVRPGVPWCSLCHADLRSPEEKAFAAGPVEPESLAVAEPELELASTSATGGGRHARRSAPSSDPANAELVVAPTQVAPGLDPLAAIDVDSMLAHLAQGDDPLVGVAGRFSNKGSVALFAFGGAALLTVLSLAAMFILGSFLH